MGIIERFWSDPLPLLALQSTVYSYSRKVCACGVRSSLLRASGAPPPQSSPRPRVQSSPPPQSSLTPSLQVRCPIANCHSGAGSGCRLTQSPIPMANGHRIRCARSRWVFSGVSTAFLGCVFSILIFHFQSSEVRVRIKIVFDRPTDCRLKLGERTERSLLG